jgi:hypothetical protein
LRPGTYFSEEQRWPSKSQRFGWLVGIGSALFVAFQLNLHLFAPLYAVPVLLGLLAILVSVLTLQQRLVVRIGTGVEADPITPVVRRFWRRAAQVAPLLPSTDGDERLQVRRIDHVVKSPVSALAPARRGSRLGRERLQIPMSDVVNWSASRLSLLAVVRPGSTTFPVGFQREAVTIILEDGRRLAVPTRRQPELLAALSAAKVDSVRQEQAASVVREEL